ncbi:hypothetical protein A4A49_57732 [Nicotiana attenuata]|uniref:Cystatin domain-containing protein n=1 Tax=Nicotiana attenuata TaxID=49451 RepID=A0A1J6KLJ9_NICAT|nr:hypothetical protein A4A49_55197 [Nicotiana attenuata]OIT22639.1 hypothetical protein A4A49_57732 [Nicotiana attenuata]
MRTTAMRSFCPTEHRPLFFPIYYRQIEQSNGFDIYDYPGISSLAGIGPYPEFNEEAELLTELANRAIREYNEKECNVFKYKLLKIEKVNTQLTGYREYFMTVKVFNLTLATPIETFQIHAAKRVYNNDKFILCCRPKEEAADG